MASFDDLLLNLERRAQQFDSEQKKQGSALTEQWFTASLFQCRSNLAVDYVAEIRRLYSQLTQTNTDEVKTFIAEQISQQALALTNALSGVTLPTVNQHPYEHTQSTLTNLHQKLATYRGYEQRLQHNVTSARDANDTITAQQQEKRLNRCQQAIAELERKIQQIEEG